MYETGDVKVTIGAEWHCVMTKSEVESLKYK